MSATLAVIEDAGLVPDDPWLTDKAERIRLRGQRITSDIIAIGQDLIEVRERLPHGAWLPWIERELAWSAKTADNFIRVAEVFGGKFVTVTNLAIDASALYLLSAPKTPPVAQIAAVDRAETGEHITKAEAQRMIAEAERKAIDRAAARIREIEAELDELAERADAEKPDLTKVDPVKVLAEMLGMDPAKPRLSKTQLHGLAQALQRPISNGRTTYPPVSETVSRDAERYASLSAKLFEALNFVRTIGDAAEFRGRIHPSVRDEILRTAPQVALWLEHLAGE